LEGLAVENVGISYVHLVFLRPFGTFYGNLVYFVYSLVFFSRFGMLYQEKSGNPVRHNSQPRTEINHSQSLSPVFKSQELTSSLHALNQQTYRNLFHTKYRQGDQIERTFAQWVVVYFGQFLKIYTK
jgi:hypothetical protein